MKVIFLDIDGVINPGNNMKRNARLKRTCENMYFDPVCINHLKTLVAHSGARVVLSSTWRLPDELTLSTAHWVNLITCLSNYGIQLYGETGPSLSTRHEEINAWLSEHPDVESYVILDDVNDDFQGENLRRLVLTNEIIGLTSSDVVKAERILQNKEINVKEVSV